MRFSAKTKLFAGTGLFLLGLIWFCVGFDIPYFSGFGIGSFNPKSIPVALAIGVMSAGNLIFLSGAREIVGEPEENTGKGV